MIRLSVAALIPSAGALCALAAPVELATDYAREVAWEVTVERSLFMETVEMSMERDGEPVGRGGGGAGGGSESIRKLAYTHKVLEHDSSDPVAVRRSFESVGGSNLMTFGENEMESDAESPFDGAEIVWRLEEGEPVAEVEEGDVDEEGLEVFGLALELDALLPDGAMDEQGTWTVDGDVFVAALGLDLEAILFPPAPREERGEGERGGGGRRGGMGGGRSTGIAALLGLEWDVELTLAEVEADSDWGSVARITFEAEGSGDPPARAGGGGGRGGEGGGESSTEGGVTAAFEGELLFLLESKHPVHFTCGGTVDVETTTTRQSRQGGEMVIRNVQTGDFSLEVTIVQVATDGDA